MRSLIVPALLLAFTVYCLIDVVRSESSDVRGLPKLAWVALVLLFPLAGGAAWFIAGRPRGTRPPGAARVGTRRPSVLGPDDDPDFLRSIDRPTPVEPPSPLADGERPGGAADGSAAARPAGASGGASGGSPGTSPGGTSGDDPDGTSDETSGEPGGQDPDRT